MKTSFPPVVQRHAFQDVARECNHLLLSKTFLRHSVPLCVGTETLLFFESQPGIDPSRVTGSSLKLYLHSLLIMRHTTASPLLHFWLLVWLRLLGSFPHASADSGSAWVTPHDSFSSSVGVLGCKINTNRVAYWPPSVNCTSICVSLSYSGRSVYLLRIDQSGGAHDVSYDAWNYLITGSSATVEPMAGGGVTMTYADVDVSYCSDLILTDDGKLPLSAANSMNYLASCLETDSWVGNNYVLYNILDAICTLGYDEKCTLDWPSANQAACPHTLGLPNVLTTAPVYNIQYPTGNSVLASSGVVVANSTGTTGMLGSQSNGERVCAGLGRVALMIITMTLSIITQWI